MSGQALDYQVFSKQVEIAPGMTKKVNIPAYEESRDYAYYKSKGGYGTKTRFKIKYKLLGYSQNRKAVKKHPTPPVKQVTHSEEQRTGFAEVFETNDAQFALMLIGFGVFGIGVVVGMYVLVVVMAQQRHRNVAGWVVASLFITPVLAIFILLCLGKSHDDPMIME